MGGEDFYFVILLVVRGAEDSKEFGCSDAKERESAKSKTSSDQEGRVIQPKERAASFLFILLVLGEQRKRLKTSKFSPKTVPWLYMLY